jgi:spermidine/putrescine transport system permease protein
MPSEAPGALPAHSAARTGISPVRRSALALAAQLLPAYLWLLIGVFLPLSAMLAFSFMTAPPFGNRTVEFTVHNYLAFFERPYLLDVAWRSLTLGFWTTAICAALGLPAALALARATGGKTRQVLFFLIILPFWTNGLVRIFSWTMVLRDGGMIDRVVQAIVPGAPSIGILYSYPAIVVGLVHAYLPYMILTCYLSLAGIDEEIFEAARSLGARAPAIFRKLVLPLAAPGLVAGSILIFVPVIGSFMEPRILGGKVGVTMGTVIEDNFTQGFNWPLGSALSFMMLAVVLAVFAAFSGALRGRLAIS